MNATHITSKKIDFLRQHLPNKSLVDLQGFLRKYCNIPLIDYLLLDLSYCLLKNQAWLDVPVYRSIIVNFLADYYQLNNCVARETTDRYIEQLRLVKDLTNKTTLSDQDFVRYIFVMTLTSKNEQHLVAELGFGDLFLRCVRDFLQAVVSCQPPESFLHDFESLCYQSLVNLADELVQAPENLALYRLRYQLLLAEPPWSSLSLTQLQAIMSLLISLDEQPTTTGQLNTFANFETTKVVTMLAKHDIVYRSDYRRRSALWCLTALGRQLVEIADVKITRRSRTVRDGSTANYSSS